MFVLFMEIKTLQLRVSVVTSIKKFLRKEQNVFIVKGAEHRFKSFAFREARMKGTLDFLKDELL